MGLDLLTLKAQWNDVLDCLERKDRIAWMAFFDARLASFDGTVLFLDYSDARKFGSSHEYQQARISHLTALKESMTEVLGENIEIQEIA
ncbi:unannotated protein [freshwater metagenome]|uniref:Unannotated protein n=1 Tax=freshwater metagenome TaxID=449393 RepID=A0A6J7XTG8_9ZZZZ|nr:hypothetical protein [Actinomycetota bacterium]